MTRGMKRSVSFDDTKNGLQETECLLDLSYAEKRERWYTNRELERSHALDERMLATRTASKEFETRGLESLMAITSLERKTCTLDLVQSVIEEQQKQWDSQVYNAEAVARVSRRLTSRHRRRALKMAHADMMNIPELAARAARERELKIRQKIIEQQQNIRQHSTKQQPSIQRQRTFMNQRPNIPQPHQRKSTETVGLRSPTRMGERSLRGIRKMFEKARRRPSCA